MRRVRYDADKSAGCLTHREIAGLLGISCTRVMQIEQAALRKLRLLLEERGVDSADEVRP